jgi:hypothetical protein
MSPEFYKFLHLVGLVLIVLSFTILSFGYYYKNQIEKPWKLIGSIGHGLGLLLILISGFGLAAKIGLFANGMGSLPIWFLTKIVFWIVIGGVVVLIRKKGYQNITLYCLVIAILLIPMFLGLFKPF